MNIKAYLESGILELYCLGVLSDDDESLVEGACAAYPAIRSELSGIEHALEEYAAVNAILPRPEMEGKILKAMQGNLGSSSGESGEFPLIDESSDLQSWLKITSDMFPETLDGSFNKILQETDKVMQVLIATSVDVEEESHDDVLESFFILEGECECTIGDHVFRLEAGGFASIPLHQPHHVKILSPYVKAVLQLESI